MSFSVYDGMTGKSRSMELDDFLKEYGPQGKHQNDNGVNIPGLIILLLIDLGFLIMMLG